MPDTSSKTSALEAESLSKEFPGVRALDAVSLLIRAGEVHGIVGENGAGKSTLMKIFSGLYSPSGGTVRVSDRAVELKHPIDAQRLGIVMIHQELNLVDELSVADNIFLGRERVKLGFVNRRATRTKSAELLQSLRCGVDPSVKVKTLSVAQKQMVEIAKALSYDARVLIMDEPTAVLTRRETEALFDVIRRLKADGVAVVYISHILPEVIALCDRITVMRDGKVVTTLEPARAKAVTERELASLMVGRPMADHFPPRAAHGEQTVLEVRNLSVPGKVIDASFEVRRGEILGFAGLIGAGRTELAEAITGLRRKSSGVILIDGREVRIDGPRDAVRAGIAYLSEDRKGTGLTLGMGIAENTTMVSLKRYCRPWIDRRAEDAATERHVRALRIKAPRLRAKIDTLSGGNQQKVALAKWLEIAPKVLIVDEPTRGVDIGAKEQIYALIQSLTEQGMATILISSELNEVLGMCDRIAVMRNGRIAAIVDAASATEDSLMFYAAGVESAAAP